MAKIREVQNSADYGRVMVDEQLQDLEARLTDLYAKTSHEMKKELDSFLDKFYENDKKKREQLEAGDITETEYKDWRNRTIFRTEAMTAKVNDLTQQMINADKTAMKMVNDQLPEIYATAWNFGGYRGETYAQAAGFDYTQFTIVNRDAVRVMATKDPDLIPWKPNVDVEEDKKWNRTHLQTAIMQGLVKGDSIPELANRLMPVVNSDKNAAVRTARTAINGIENKGRKDATERVREAGIPMEEKWSCTHDNRTRDTHILLDGTLPNEDGLYGTGIIDTLLEYPADPAGDPEEVYNCRCSIVSTIKGIDHSKDDELYEKMMEEEYYDDWLAVKEAREEKEAQFQEKRAGAAERVEERRERYQAMFEPNEKLDKANEKEDKIDPETKIANFAGKETKSMQERAEEIQAMSEDEIYKEFVPKDSYIYSPEYQRAEQEWEKAHEEYKQIRDRREEIAEDIKSERTVKPKSEWTFDDEIESMIGHRPMAYTERGEELKAEDERLFTAYLEAEKKMSEASDITERISREEARREIEEWKEDAHPFAKADKDDDFIGFSTTMRSAFDEDLANGIGFIAEMTPDEYLQRISFDIFETTVEHATVVDFANVKKYADLMASGVKMDMGYINYDIRGTGKFGQEGRHRAMAAKLLEIDRIPVYIRGIGVSGRR